jgi:hypothetical protein
VVEIQKGILLYSCHIVRKFLNIDTEHKTQKSQNVIMLISTALLLDNIIRNSVCTPAKLPYRRVVKSKKKYNKNKENNYDVNKKINNKIILQLFVHFK